MQNTSIIYRNIEAARYDHMVAWVTNTNIQQLSAWAGHLLHVNFPDTATTSWVKLART